MFSVNIIIAILMFTIIAAFSVIIVQLIRLQDKEHALRRERKLRRETEYKLREAIEETENAYLQQRSTAERLSGICQQQRAEQLALIRDRWRKMDSLFEVYAQRLSSIERLSTIATSSMNTIRDLSDSLHGQINTLMASLLEPETVKSSTESARDSADEKEGVQAASKEP